MVDKLVEECSENIDGNEIIYNDTLYAISLNDYRNVCNSCAMYIVSFAIFLIISVSIIFIFIGISKEIIIGLSLILILKQQFMEGNSVEFN